MVSLALFCRDLFGDMTDSWLPSPITFVLYSCIGQLPYVVDAEDSGSRHKVAKGCGNGWRALEVTATPPTGQINPTNKGVTLAGTANAVSDMLSIQY